MRQRNPNKPKYLSGHLVRYKRSCFRVIYSTMVMGLSRKRVSYLYWLSLPGTSTMKLARESGLKALSSEEAFLLSL